MKTVWNYNRRLLAMLLFTLLSVFTGNAVLPLPFRLSKGAGTFRLGMVCGHQSRWLDECNITKEGQQYILKDKLWKGGEVRLVIRPLTHTDGFVMEVSGERLPEDTRLCWAFGGCDGRDGSASSGSVIPPAACADNVFSVEGNAFTTYYGESMKLRTTQGVAPLGSKICLSDARQQESPLKLYHSGKKTDAPVISALCPWKPQEKLYFCFYKRNAKADYNYFMLPGLFQNESKTDPK